MLFFFLSAPLLAAEEETVEKKAALPLEIGDEMPEFTLPDATGNYYRLSDFAGNFLIFYFRSRDCREVRRLEKKVAKLTEDYGDWNLVFLGVDVPIYGLKETRKVKKTAEPVYPVLIDKKMELVKIFGAAVTPQVFILDADKKLIYSGALLGRGADGLEIEYVRKIIDALILGEPMPYLKTEPYGCRIKKK